MNKSKTLSDPSSCLNRAASDEPIFTLRAKDPFAAQAVRHWATMAAGRHEPAKIDDALALALEMDQWRNARFDADGKPHPEVRSVMDKR